VEVNETRCNHITFYRTSCCKPSILAVEKSGRNAFNGRIVLAGGICVCSWNRVSEKVVRKDPGSAAPAGSDGRSNTRILRSYYIEKQKEKQAK